MLAIAFLGSPHGGPDVSWLMWVAFGFFALMVVVGWLSAKKGKNDETRPDGHENHEEEASTHDQPAH